MDTPNIGDVVTCKDNSFIGGAFTVGKSYEVIECPYPILNTFDLLFQDHVLERLSTKWVWFVDNFGGISKMNLDMFEMTFELPNNLFGVY